MAVSSEYQLIGHFNGVKRARDNAMIPNNGGNRDWQEYQDWLAAGNEPLPVLDMTPTDKTWLGDPWTF